MPRAEVTFPHLPAAPMAEALARAQAAKPARNLCDEAGVADRSFRDWRMGSRPTIQFVTADKLLTRLGIFWWEVWNEDTTRRYAITVTTYAYYWSKGKDRRDKTRRERIRTRRYVDLGPDRDALALVEYAFTGERPDQDEQLELAA